MTTSRRERLAATVQGQATDRPPVALWRHFPGDDQNADNLAAAHIRFQETYDFDFLKVTPSSTYAVDDYGVETAWTGNIEGTRAVTRFPMPALDALAGLPSLDVSRGGYGLARAALRTICTTLDSDVTVLQTIFSPISQLKKLVGPQLLPLLRLHPDVAQAALRRLTANTVQHIESLAPTGLSGVFYAVQHGTAHLLSRAEYATFGRPYDLQILKAVPADWFKLLHLHGSDVYFDDFVTYPVQAINWHDRETEPSLAGGLAAFGGAVVGGLRQLDTLMRGTPQAVRAEALEAWQQSGGRRFVLGTGCVTMIVTPEANLAAARDAVNAMVR